MGGQGLADVRVALGRLAPGDVSLARSKQAPTSGAVLQQGAFVLRAHALHRHQPLFFRTGPQGMLAKDALAATAVALLDQKHLIGRGRDNKLGCACSSREVRPMHAPQPEVTGGHDGPSGGGSRRSASEFGLQPERHAPAGL